ncbi:DUF4331 domain-containing protein [Candidatus Bathyarchaeota archaeon]|nr:MAG: DUF4331 domain-containing protein [Candidatus Bathyarchaeota archaeon]
MTSHREAPRISKDPVADNTDLYAFVSPDKPDSVTILASYIPLEEPAGGPNFNAFGDDVLYEILIDNNGDGKEDITYQFRFDTKIGNPESFLYNTGPIDSLDSADWNVKQTYSVRRVLGRRRTGRSSLLRSDIPTPPVNIGPRSTPGYADLANAAIMTLDDGSTVFAGQRDEAFYVDLGSIFDLGTLRPVQNFHLISTPAAAGVDTTKGFSVHTIAIQVPKNLLTRDGSTPGSGDFAKPASTISVWASASRRKATILPTDGDDEGDDDDDESEPVITHGPWNQVSRLGMPLINEVIIPLGHKDQWNEFHPRFDSRFIQYYKTPELQKLLPILYPGVFPNLAAYSKDRADLIAILLTGVPGGIISGFQNFTGPIQSDQLRLNMAYAPSSAPNRLGLLGGQLDGFPNGRRVQDDVIDIEIRAVAGATLPLVDPSFAPDAAVGLLSDGVDTNPVQSPNAASFLSVFPYLPHPVSGYDHRHD